MSDDIMREIDSIQRNLGSLLKNQYEMSDRLHTIEEYLMGSLEKNKLGLKAEFDEIRKKVEHLMNSKNKSKRDLFLVFKEIGVAVAIVYLIIKMGLT